MVTRRFLSRENIARVSTEILGDLLSGQQEQDVTQRSATQRYRIGSRLVKGGRTFHYAHIGDGTYGVTVQPTQVRLAYGVSASIWAATDENNVTGAVVAPLGARTITYVTTGAIVANQFAGGFISVGAAPYGVTVQIKSHPAAGAGATVVLTLEDPLPAAVPAGTAVALYRSPYANIISPRQAAIEGCADPNTNQQTFLGVPLVEGLAGEYIWVQTWGPACVVSGSGAEGTNPHERQLVWDAGDGSVQLVGGEYALARSWQYAGYILPTTNSAVALPTVGVPGGPDGMLYMMLQCDP